MIDMPHTPGHRLLHLVESGMRMAGIAADAMPATSADKLFGAGQLGRDRGRAHAIGVPQILLVLRTNRRPHRRLGMAAARFSAKVGPIEMGADNACPIRGLTILARLEFAANVEERHVL